MIQKERIEKFSDDQIEALARIEEFKKTRINPKDINTRVLVITGPAGSGKTTLIRYGLEEYIMRDDESELDDEGGFNLFSKQPNVVGVCLAHQAKNNLKKSISYTKTFASYFGMKEVHGDEGQRSFEIDTFMIANSACKQPVKFAVHDEVSQYDELMIKTVLEETHPKTKMILMGDHCQLPPINTVGDEDSPAFKMFPNLIKLTTRHRQSGENPILPLSDIFREEIDGNQNMQRCMDALMKDNVINGNGHYVIPYRNFLKEFKACGPDFMQVKVIAYRRQKVQDYNLAIRAYLYPNADAMFIPGEIVYMNDTFLQEEKVPINAEDHLDEAIQNQSAEPQYYCYNSDQYKINDVQLDFVQGVKVYKIYFDKSGRPDIKADRPYFPYPHPQGMTEYNKTFYYRKSKALNESDRNKKKQYWKYFYQFKNSFGDCSYGYALTGHKAQGSGYTHIFVDVNDILTVGPISNKRKLQAIYTAMTRATDLVRFLKSNTK